eukprot:s1917_g5.t1
MYSLNSEVFSDGTMLTAQTVPSAALKRTIQEQLVEEEEEDEEVPNAESALRVQSSSEDGHEAGPVAYQLPRKIHIYFSDTGGGHRASALALEAALEKQYGSQVSVELIDFFRAAMPWPLSQAPETYQTLGNFPSVYKRAWDYDQDSEKWQDTTSYQWMWSYSKEHIVKYLQPLDLDLVISVHPLIHHLVIEALEEISRGPALGSFWESLGSFWFWKVLKGSGRFQVVQEVLLFWQFW